MCCVVVQYMVQVEFDSNIAELSVCIKTSVRVSNYDFENVKERSTLYSCERCMHEKASWKGPWFEPEIGS